MMKILKNLAKITVYFIVSYIFIATLQTSVLTIYNFDIFRAGALLFCDTNNIQSTSGRILIFFLVFLALIIAMAIFSFASLIGYWVLPLWSFINPIKYNVWLAELYIPLTTYLHPLKVYGDDIGLGYTHNIQIGFSILFIISFICGIIYILFFDNNPKNQ